MTEARKFPLRFITCGSVDDGKSTLIGRLLYESKLVFDDQFQAVVRDSRKFGTTGEEPDLALIVDGLEAEREQGITIDVAYRFFQTPRRSFIVADTPGHEQFTRNMVTGASTADLAIVLVDARKGMTTQTKRHIFIASLLGLKDILIAINKMDLVGFSPAVFSAITSECERFLTKFAFANTAIIPVSARNGDNVLKASDSTPWYLGPTLVAALESAPEALLADADAPLRFPVQWVNRPNADFRGLAGTLASGTLRVGDRLTIAKSGQNTRVRAISTFDGEREVAIAGDAVTILLDEELDVARGDVLVSPDARPEVSDQFTADLVWMNGQAMIPGRTYLLKMGTQTETVRISELKHKIDVSSGEKVAGRTLASNEIGSANFVCVSPVAFDPYDTNRRMGSFILIDRLSNETVGAGMVRHGLRRAQNVHRHPQDVSKELRSQKLNQKPMVVWFTGLSGSGKSTIANKLDQLLLHEGLHTMILDGDNLRHGLCQNLGFTEADRVENIRRVGEVAKLFVEAGLIVICSLISPYAADRRMARGMVAPGEFCEVFVDTPLEICIERDPKGLYKRAFSGEIPNFTGVNAPYERPQEPELVIGATGVSADQAAASVRNFVLQRQAEFVSKSAKT